MPLVGWLHGIVVHVALDQLRRRRVRRLALPSLGKSPVARLDTVDGLFVGPSDLSLRRGRGRYRRTEADREDLVRIAAAAAAAGKPWIMPAWTAEEQQWAQGLGAHLQIIVEEQALLADGLRAVLEPLSPG